MKTLIVLPSFNEKENINDLIKAILAISKLFYIVVVDDNSPDGTYEAVEKLKTNMSNFDNERIHLIKRFEKDGRGGAVWDGIRWGLSSSNDFEHFIEMDCDFSHDPNDLARLKKACEDGADFSIGSRYVKGVNVVNWPMSRVLLSYFASVYVRFITGMPIQDATAGFKCYKRTTLEGINFDKIHFVGYAFQIEMKFKVWQRKMSIVEVPVIFTDRTEGQSKMSSGIIKEAIFGVIKLKLWSLFQKTN